LLELPRRQLSGLPQQGIRECDFPHVVEGCCLPDQLDLAFDEPEPAGDRRRGPRDPLVVLGCPLVMELGGERQPRQRLFLCLLELARALLQVDRPLRHGSLEQLLILPFPLREQLAVGDVARGRDQRLRERIGSRSPLEPAVRAVLRPIAILEVEDLAARDSLIGDRLQRRIAIVRVHEVEQRPSEQLPLYCSGSAPSDRHS